MTEPFCTEVDRIDFLTASVHRNIDLFAAERIGFVPKLNVFNNMAVALDRALFAWNAKCDLAPDELIAVSRSCVHIRPGIDVTVI